MRRTKLYGAPFPVFGIAFRRWLYEAPTSPVGGRHGFVLSQLSSLNAQRGRGGHEDDGCQGSYGEKRGETDPAAGHPAAEGSRHVRAGQRM